MNWYTLASDSTRKEMASLGGPMRLLVGAAESNGMLSVMEQRLDEPGGPPLHVRDDSDGSGIEKQLHDQAVYFQNLRGRPDMASIAEIWGDEGPRGRGPLPMP